MLLEVEQLHAAYGSSHVLHGVRLEVGEGEVVGLMGRNGMGKTTLVHVIAGIHPARSGAIRLRGASLRELPPERVWSAGITLVPQGRRVFASLTVGENLEVALRPDPAAGGWCIEEVCERFGVLGERWAQRAGTLSGGEQQMLAIARALVGNGRLVLMDEPSEGLDPSRVTLVADVIRELRRRGTAVLLVEQKVDLVLDVADRVNILARGQVVHHADASQLRRDPAEIVRHLGLG